MFSEHSRGTTDDQQKISSSKRLIVAAILAVAIVASLTTVSLKRTRKPGVKADYVWNDVTYTCSPGMFIEDGVGCLYCPPGTKCPNEDTIAPEDCQPGYWQDKKGKTTCKAANVGHFVPNAKGTQEDPCPAGKYQGLEHQAQCEDARIGHCAETTGMHKDTPCPPDTYQDQTGQTACKPCPAGQHQPFVGQPQCMSNVNIPWATLVPFASYTALQSAIQNHGCPDGLLTTDTAEPQLWSTIDVNPCEITGSSISIKAYSGNSQNIATNTLTVSASGITCTGQAFAWSDPTVAKNWPCAWTDFAKVKLIYSTGSAGRTFQNMVGQKATMVEAMTAGYASPIQIKFADGRLVELDSYQQTGAVGGNIGYRLARYWHDGSGNQFSLEINGADECHYCDVVGGVVGPCQIGKRPGDVINVRVFTPATTFKCGTDVSVQLPPPQPECYPNGLEGLSAADCAAIGGTVQTGVPFYNGHIQGTKDLCMTTSCRTPPGHRISFGNDLKLDSTANCGSTGYPLTLHTNVATVCNGMGGVLSGFTCSGLSLCASGKYYFSYTHTCGTYWAGTYMTKADCGKLHGQINNAARPDTDIFLCHFYAACQ